MIHSISTLGGVGGVSHAGKNSSWGTHHDTTGTNTTCTNATMSQNHHVRRLGTYQTTDRHKAIELGSRRAWWHSWGIIKSWNEYCRRRKIWLWAIWRTLEMVVQRMMMEVERRRGLGDRKCKWWWAMWYQDERSIRDILNCSARRGEHCIFGLIGQHDIFKQ